MQKKYLMAYSAAAAITMAAFVAPAQAQVLEDEVIVTATKRASSLQDVSLAVQAFDAKRLEEQNIDSFEDYVKYLPSVNAGGRGPGQNEIYIRGAAIDAINITVAESQGSAPNVALYLDEQPVTQGGRNMDVYIADMERIEVLPGPQGTLYGASSMAGTVRLITNKPVLNEFSASASASYSFTKGGEDSTALEAVVNVPVIEDKFALRGVFYTDKKGGYIDNVAGTFQANNAVNPAFPGSSVFYPNGTTFVNGTTVTNPAGVNIPVAFATANNAALVEDNFNDATYTGMRVGAKYVVNDDWDVLLQHSRQTLDTSGVWDFDPTKGDLNVSRFQEDSNHDEFSQTAWTVNGRLGQLDMVYTGAYLDRDVEAKIDYTGYTNIGGFIPGYQCEYLVGSFYNGVGSAASTTYGLDPTMGGNPGVIECGDPSNSAHITNKNKRFTQELRLVSDFDGPVNFTVGAYYEKFKIEHIGRFNYQAPIDLGFAPIDVSTRSDFPLDTLNTAEINPATQFRNDNDRTEKQMALYGEVKWDITEQFNLAAGARYYDLEYDFTGVGAWRYGNRPLFIDDADPTNDIRPNVTGGRSYDNVYNDLTPLKRDDILLKFTGTWTPNDDMLFYASWSDGYRPPGVNRAAATAVGSQAGEGLYVAGANNTNNDGLQCGEAVAINSRSNGFPGFCLPFAFNSDTFESMELGWKTTLMDGRMRFNGAFYKTDWKDIQVSQFDSQNVSVLTFIVNGGDAEILGFEGDMQYAATDNLTLFLAGSFNDTELVRIDPALDFLLADAGSPLPLTPKVQFSTRARYEWDMGSDNQAFWQLGAKYAGKSKNSLVDTVAEPQLDQGSYFIVDGAIGIGDEDAGWKAELFATNITDERAQLNINRQDFIQRTTTNRPRTIGLRVRFDMD
ncbi:MAG: TonB-dependent receptor [Maricaulaceae bacterium]